MYKSPKNSIDLFKVIKIAIGWEQSTMFCRKVKPDVPACNSKYPFTLGFKITSSFTFNGNFNEIQLSVISMFSLPV